MIHIIEEANKPTKIVNEYYDKMYEAYHNISDAEAMKLVSEVYAIGVSAVANKKWDNYFHINNFSNKVLYAAYSQGVDDMEDSLVFKTRFVAKTKEEILKELNLV